MFFTENLDAFLKYQRSMAPSGITLDLFLGHALTGSVAPDTADRNCGDV